jgi:hypothetical protein
MVAATAASVLATVVLPSPLFTAADVSVFTTADLSSFVGETFAITDVVLTAGASAGTFLVSVALDVSVALAESGAKPCIAPSDTTKLTPKITGLTSSEYHKVLDMSLPQERGRFHRPLVRDSQGLYLFFSESKSLSKTFIHA